MLFQHELVLKATSREALCAAVRKVAEDTVKKSAGSMSVDAMEAKLWTDNPEIFQRYENMPKGELTTWVKASSLPETIGEGILDQAAHKIAKRDNVTIEKAYGVAMMENPELYQNCQLEAEAHRIAKANGASSAAADGAEGDSDKCTGCGNEVEDDDKFCSNCGDAIPRDANKRKQPARAAA